MQGGLLGEKGVVVLKERFAKQWFERRKRAEKLSANAQ
jgi:hypothetical protein